MQKVKVGVIGCGMISGIYLQNCTRTFENVEVAAVADLVPELAQKQAADYGNFVAICYSQEIALKVIEDYVTLKTGETMPIENNKVLKR